MIIEMALLLVGLYLIVKGSDLITDAAAQLATIFSTTYIAVGLLLVSTLLSLPELLVALSTTLKGHVDIGIGVAIGSIIVNLGLIMGISAMIRPIKIPRHVITRDAVFMVVATIVVALVIFEDFSVSRRDGFVFLLLFLPYMINVHEQEKMLAVNERKKEAKGIIKTLESIGELGFVHITIKDAKWIFLSGAALLLIGTELFTNSLITLTAFFGVPEILMGLTIGALGPSIPNLAAALQAVRKGYDGLVVSEIIGSNIFTLLITIGILAIVKPFSIDASAVAITMPALFVITSVFFLMILRGTITRTAGFILFALYALAVAAEVFLR